MTALNKESVQEAVKALKQKLNWDAVGTPKVAVVLGSGLGAFCDSLTETQSVSYSEISGMPQTTVKGHAGQWVLGKTKAGHAVLAAQGRFHVYEGHSGEAVSLPVRMMAGLGIKHVILTNAAGSVNPQFRPGDFMLIRDHINNMYFSPLANERAEDYGARFVDMSEPYDLSIIDAVAKKAIELNDTVVHQGVYCANRGPQYETPAEVKMLGVLGADAVGMSTVPETIAARQAGLKVNGISLITNLGSGLGQSELNHQEVTDLGKASGPKFAALVELMIGQIGI